MEIHVTIQVFKVLELVLVSFLILFYPATWHFLDSESDRSFILCLNK